MSIFGSMFKKDVVVNELSCILKMEDKTLDTDEKG
jgi:hypothetical protein